MTDDEKSFRERVEEIREKREQERNNDDSHVGQGIQANQQGDIQPNIPDMDQLLEQMGTEVSGCRVVVETHDTRLEFLDQPVYRSHTTSGMIYQLIGVPDKKEPIDSHTESQAATPSSSNDSTTQVFTPDTNGGSESQTGSVNYCPGCGSDLESFADVQYCPHCGRAL